MQDQQTSHFGAILRAGGHKATRGRIALLIALARAGRELTITEIRHRLKKKMDEVTVYRALEALATSGIVRRVDLRHAHAHYELITGKQHHHHLVCTSCGKVEDIAVCGTDRLEKEALARSTAFTKLQDHALEFFGMCKKCTGIASASNLSQ